ncbi:accessory gene regulator B family protein [Tissierella sp. MB52-C2]|uniref:accessory gene regulator B family protein n=1 Tax=Tissierella sp. MB52-C2 TaxID=3070999 RepID=UPI00280B24F0|nr:accessory gene regulator B family protein [Tissierella sp. MB52-C2]WMM24592.1 accessory gene regulator B family protein [Tissierella sp. MB52-C2]
MISQFIRRYVSWSTTDDEIGVILYGMKIIGTSILTALIIVLIGIIMRQTVSSIIYLGVLILLRRNMGGYHSKTYLGCLFITSLNFIIIGLLEIYLDSTLKQILGIIFIIYSTVKIYTTKPIVHTNRTVDEDTINKSIVKKDKWLSVILVLATICHVLIVLDIVDVLNYFFAISSSLMVVALSI